MYGNAKAYNRKNNIISVRIQRLEEPEEIVCHLLSFVYAHVKTINSQNTGHGQFVRYVRTPYSSMFLTEIQQNMANMASVPHLNQPNNNFNNNYGNEYADFPPVAQATMLVFKSCTDDTGLSIANAVQALSGQFSEREVRYVPCLRIP